MSSIGSSPGIGSGTQIEVNALRSVSAADQSTVAVASASAQAANATKTADAAAQSATANSATASQMVTSTALNAGQVPVDHTRVTSIKKAIETGTYPLVPAKIGDAMIAAGLLLRESPMSLTTDSLRDSLRQMVDVLQNERTALAGMDMDAILGCAQNKDRLCGTLAGTGTELIDEECRGLLDAARRLNEVNRQIRNLIAANVAARLEAITGSPAIYRAGGAPAYAYAGGRA